MTGRFGEATVTTMHDQAIVATTGRAVPRWAQPMRVLGWLLIGAGVITGLFIVYLLYWTGHETDLVQTQMLDQWEARVDDWQLEMGWELDLDATQLEEVPVVLATVPDDDPGASRPVDAGDAYAVMWFERDGQRVISETNLSIVQGVSLDDLSSGPGHYPDTEAPGQQGNFAVSGHRTTYSEPFYNLEKLRQGDEIHVIDRDGRHFVYDYLEQMIVDPDDVWVLGDDPLDLGDGSYMTMTTCHPRFSARQRLIAFAALRTEAP